MYYVPIKSHDILSSPFPSQLSVFVLSVLNIFAISGARGSSGLGSHRSEQVERSILETVRAGDPFLELPRVI